MNTVSLFLQCCRDSAGLAANESCCVNASLPPLEVAPVLLLAPALPAALAPAPAFRLVDVVAGKRARVIRVCDWARDQLAAKQRQNLSRGPPPAAGSGSCSLFPATSGPRRVCLPEEVLHCAVLRCASLLSVPAPFLAFPSSPPFDSRSSIDPSAPRPKQYLHHFLPFPACSV